jgi:DNA-binding MarR family transcriptional regulator
MLDRLEENGYLQRVASSEDRRQILIKLTPKNRLVQETHQRVSDEMADLFYRGFSEEEIAEFEERLGRVYRNLSECEEKEY